MRQKFLYLCFLMVLSCVFSKVFAQTIEVSALENFSTAQPPKTISVKLLEPLEISGQEVIISGTILKGNIIDVVSPKRLKRDAGFSFQPTEYTDLNGKTHQINSYITASYTKPVDKGSIAKNTALGVGNFFVKGLSIGVAAVSGAVKNTEGNRLKSSAKSMYESSPLSYAEKGEDLYIAKFQSFLLKFPDLRK
ncbi:MAG: hypothetical protein K2F57_07420 [Candidatus Gastranaerophilales bacterium]|nr:hypothetical protein [Candidatus Gastranaerophilales bacterium]